ncbi:hypothetical protein PM082_019368 [Marasmius tenuissimus]|nr:hypothetical protein PM082_019368 [Marasmius tenuissimus]
MSLNSTQFTISGASSMTFTTQTTPRLPIDRAYRSSGRVIPRPDGLVIIKGGGGVFSLMKHLERHGIMDKETFGAFKCFVRKAAFEDFKSMKVNHSEQPASEWQRFESKVCSEFPTLRRCVENWPLSFYYDVWMHSRWRKGRRGKEGMKPKGGVEHAHNDSVRRVTAADSSTRQIDFRAASSDRTSETPSVSSVISSYISKLQSHTRPKELAAVAYGASASNDRSRNILRRDSPRPSQYSDHSDEPTRIASTSNLPYIDTCIVCGNPSIASGAAQNQQLKELLDEGKVEDLETILKAFGIYHDGHLGLLQVLRIDERLEILRSIPDIVGVDAFCLEKVLARGKLAQTLIVPNRVVTACSAHRTQIENSRVTPKLEASLKTQGLDTLHTVAALYGLTDDDRLTRFSRLDERESSEFFESGHAQKVSLFYHRLLRYVVSQV